MMKMNCIILKNELDDDHLLWVRACEMFPKVIDYFIVDLIRNDWLERIQEKKPNVLLAKPGGVNQTFKQLYDERIYILERVLGYHVFPSAEEIFFYENKRFLASWLKANQIPHPATDVFYFQDEAFDAIGKSTFPLVAKTNIGASGSGVTILKTKAEAIQYVKNVFSGKGATQRTGPNLEKGGIIKRGLYYVFHPAKIKNKLRIYRLRSESIQKGFVILQEFIPHHFEWRVVRIGDSFFAHKKMVKGEKASGSLIKGYDNPPLSLFDFVKHITNKHKLYSQAVDIFETGQGYLVNEMQCIFGQSDPYQMLVDGKPGRYLFLNESWVFEEGDFNQLESYKLRIEHLIETLSKQ
jgi:glutathione synthase/RimK-type ligase-like ATP-grasp enzyme